MPTNDLMRPAVPSALVEVATGGYATSSIQRNWIARDVIETPIPEPRAGKPRMWPLLAVYEAALLSWASESGVGLGVIKGAFQILKRRCLPGDGGWEDYEFIEAANRGDLKEFSPRLDGTAAYWVVSVEVCNVTTPDGVPRPTAIDLERGESQFLEKMIARANKGDSVVPCVVINISKLVEMVNLRLSDAGWAAEPTT